MTGVAAPAVRATLVDELGMSGRERRSGVGQLSPVDVTAASIGSASPNTHLYLAPAGSSGSVLIVS